MASSVNCQHLNRLGQCANVPGNGAYCYAELAVSSLVVALAIASTHYWRMARLSWSVWLG